MSAVKRVDVTPVLAREGMEAMCERVRYPGQGNGTGTRKSNETPGGETVRGEERGDG